MRWCAVLAAVGLLTGCVPRVASMPALLQSQATLPPALPALFAQGRLRLTAPGKALSCTALVRVLPHGAVRVVLLSDEGLELLDLTSGAEGITVTQQVPGVARLVPILGRMVGQAYGRAPPARLVRDHGRLLQRTPAGTRIYGGDPLALRGVVGGGFGLAMSDFVPLGGALVPLAVTATAPADVVRVTLTLGRSHLRLLGAVTAAPDYERLH